jgi:hypothetical protein
VILRDPTETHDQPGDPSGKGPATEMLNCLRVTDVNQLPGLLSPASGEFDGKMPAAFQWSCDVLAKAGKRQITTSH